MNPQLTAIILNEAASDMQRRAEASRQPLRAVRRGPVEGPRPSRAELASTHSQSTEAQLTIRRARDTDEAALGRLADRDSSTAPGGDVLVAESEGRLLAAISLADGALIADPFARTGELRSLLSLRAGQLGTRT